MGVQGREASEGRAGQNGGELGLILKLWEPAGFYALRMQQLRMQKSPQLSVGTDRSSGGRWQLAD